MMTASLTILMTMTSFTCDGKNISWYLIIVLVTLKVLVLQAFIIYVTNDPPMKSKDFIFITTILNGKQRERESDYILDL